MSSTETEITRPSLDDAYGSLNWFDEQAIKKHLNVDVHELMGALAEEKSGLRDFIELVRAFELVAALRDGLTEPVALAKVRKLTAKEINDLAEAYFDHGDEETDDPDEPKTEAGKGDSDSE